METARGNADVGRRLRMSTVTLFAKGHSPLQLEGINKNLNSLLHGLKVETKICGTNPRGWIQVSISGEDENAAIHYLDDIIGLCPVSLPDVFRYVTMKGRITGLRKNREELRVDMGVLSPDMCDAVIQLSSLQAQLVDGRRVSLDKIVELFGLCENLPLTVKIDNFHKEKSQVEAVIAYEQRSRWNKWAESMLDRLVVLGSSLDRIEVAVAKAELKRDVVSIEPLGGFEYAIICKLGTDAVGLIPKIGRNLREASFAVFSPKRILAFFGSELPLPIS